MQDGGENRCLLCGDEFDSAEELEDHHEFAHPEPEEKLTWGGCLLAVPVLLIMGWRWLLGIFVVVGIILAAFGVFDKSAAPESRNCPGYGFVRDLKAKGQINSFESVEPKSGWRCEYALDNEDADIRFKVTRHELNLEVEGRRGTAAYEAAQKEAAARGYVVE